MVHPIRKGYCLPHDQRSFPITVTSDHTGINIGMNIGMNIVMLFEELKRICVVVRCVGKDGSKFGLSAN